MLTALVSTQPPTQRKDMPDGSLSNLLPFEI